MEIISNSIEDTRKFTQNFLESLSEERQKAKIVGLKGDLGSGKTTFVQLVAGELGVGEKITSPTFVIMKKYPIDNFKGFSSLVHIDAYRLDEARELAVLDFEEDASNPKNLIFIEWPERVSEILPKETNFIDFEFIDENTRKIVRR